MKLSFTALVLIFCGVCVTSIKAESGIEANNAARQTSVPILKLKNTIDLGFVGPSSVIEKLSFSPDGHYLAIVDNASIMKTDIVVWDLQRNKMQSHIHSPIDYGDSLSNDLLWSRDGKAIYFGAKNQWDPISGESLPDSLVIGRAARLNKDGDKLFTIVGDVVSPSYIYIYDTKDWSVKKIYADGLYVGTAAWTSENKIMLGVWGTKNTINKMMDGRFLAAMDVGLRLIDPLGNSPTKTIWYPAVPDDRPHYYPWTRSADVSLSASSYASNQIALGAGQIIDGRTMNILTYYSHDELVNKISLAASGGMVFSADGRYLFLKDLRSIEIGGSHATNVIIDASTGKVVSRFNGGHKGIAISPNGKSLAIGDLNSVQVFDLQ